MIARDFRKTPATSTLTALAAAALLLGAGAAGCSGESTPGGGGPGPGGGRGDLGSATFTVTGAIEGEFSGQADFASFESTAVNTWEISIHDFSPQTFSLTLNQMSGNVPLSRPEPGTYPISVGGPGIFHASWVDTSGGFADSTEYQVNGEGLGGTLVITASSDAEVVGTFEFTAATSDRDGNLGDRITVKDGRFNAKKRIR